MTNAHREYLDELLKFERFSEVLKELSKIARQRAIARRNNAFHQLATDYDAAAGAIEAIAGKITV
jgi:hypothetical protein